MATPKTYKLGKIEILRESLPPMTLNQAKKECSILGDGWRLPNFGEFVLMQGLHDLGVGNFKPHEDSSPIWIQNPFSRDCHWTSHEHPDGNGKACIWSFQSGEDGGDWYGKSSTLTNWGDEIFQVRPVRSL